MSLAASAGRGPGALWSPTHVQVTVLQARGLQSKGPESTSDAYAVIQVGKEKYATSVSERSLGAPVWREEAFELPPLLASGAAPAAAATLQLTVLHRALLGLDKFLGRAEVDLRELHRDQGRRKTQWYRLRSKPGKQDKERGEIEVDIQFMRNSMTASMFDLSVKDKSRNPFGKLKDKIKGKSKDSASDTASAIVPSTMASADSDDEAPSKDKKKKSKIKTLFSKSNLQKTPLSQSMSVLPTSKPDKVLLRPGDLQSRWGDEDEDEPSSAADVTSHKRTASADPKQLSQINFSLPFLSGLRSKNDVLSRSNVCINGSHVYLEQPEARSETKDSSASSSPSPQGFRKKRLFSSTENLASRPWKEPGDGGGAAADRWFSESPAPDAGKAMTLPSYRPQVTGDAQEDRALASMEAARETQEGKKQESKKASLLSLVTGKKDAAKGGEGESKEKEGKLGPTGDAAAAASAQGHALNPFEDVQITEAEADPESQAGPKPPVPTPRALQTKAVKPRLHPVKPMNTTAPKSAHASLGTATIISENLINEAMMKKYSPSDPASAYAQLTHDELIQLVLKQKETISKKEFQVRELEDYIDNLLVRVMEETPNILRIPAQAQAGRRAGKM
uniref:Rab11 family-interacting protein 1 n=1 Tax=Oryctolagus cuniculus TaxID=9986 RepID=A0A5F9D5P9_RABIT